MTPNFVFPWVTILILFRLPELTCLYPGMHTSEWLALRNLVGCHCDKTKDIRFRIIQLSCKYWEQSTSYPTATALVLVRKGMNPIFRFYQFSPCFLFLSWAVVAEKPKNLCSLFSTWLTWETLQSKKSPTLLYFIQRDILKWRMLGETCWEVRTEKTLTAVQT